MKYTIVDDRGVRFISRNYDSTEAAEKKIAALKEKFGDRYALSVVGVDNEGNLHKPTKETKETKGQKTA